MQYLDYLKCLHTSCGTWNDTYQFLHYLRYNRDSVQCQYTEIFKAGLRKPLLVLCTILPVHKICTVGLYKTETIPFQSLSM